VSSSELGTSTLDGDDGTWLNNTDLGAGPVEGRGAWFQHGRRDRAGDGELDPTVRAALLESTRIEEEARQRQATNPRPAVTSVERELSARFHAELKAARRKLGAAAKLQGPWIDAITPLPPDRAAATLAALSAGASFLHFASRASGTNGNRERHLRDWLVFCRLLGVHPYLSDARDARTLHAYIAWKGLSYVKARQKPGTPLGIQSDSLANQLSSIRTFHQEMLGVNLHKIDPLSRQLVKGVKRISGPRKARLRVSHRMMLDMEALDVQSGSESDRAQALARRWCFEAMLRLSEVALTSSGVWHFLLDEDVVFSDFDVHGRPHTMQWKLRSAKNSQFAGVVRSMVARPDSPGDFVSWMWEQKKRNALFRKRNPRARDRLPFIHVNGSPLKKSSVQSHLRKRLSQLPSFGSANLRLFQAGTHCLRRGGARMWLNLGVGEAYLRWLGGWRSLAWLVYPAVADGLKQRAASLRAEHMRRALATQKRGAI
jgi:hypothetical protein